MPESKQHMIYWTHCQEFNNTILQFNTTPNAIQYDNATFDAIYFPQLAKAPKHITCHASGILDNTNQEPACNSMDYRHEAY